jgi:hypothetical protein
MDVTALFDRKRVDSATIRTFIVTIILRAVLFLTRRRPIVSDSRRKGGGVLARP